MSQDTSVLPPTISNSNRPIAYGGPSENPLIGRGAPPLGDLTKGKKRKAPATKKTSRKIRVQASSSAQPTQTTEMAPAMAVIPISSADPAPVPAQPTDESTAPTTVAIQLADPPRPSTVNLPSAPVQPAAQDLPQNSPISINSSSTGNIPSHFRDH
jgi:hypothetical protein